MNWYLFFYEVIIFGIFGGVIASGGVTLKTWQFWVCLGCMVLIQNGHTFIK